MNQTLEGIKKQADQLTRDEKQELINYLETSDQQPGREEDADVTTQEFEIVDEMMTWEEIQSRYEGEWVLIGDPETTPALQVIRGKLLWHSPDKRALYRKARELRPEDAAILFTGSRFREEAEYVL